MFDGEACAQSPLDLRTGPSTTEGGTRSRSLRGTIVARASPSRAHDNDCLRLSPESPPRKSETGKKESTDHRLNQACRRCAKTSSISCFDRRLSGAHTVENGSTTRRLKKICQSSARRRSQSVDPTRTPTRVNLYADNCRRSQFRRAASGQNVWRVSQSFRWLPPHL